MVTLLPVPMDTLPHNQEYRMAIQDQIVTPDLLMDIVHLQMDITDLLTDMLAIMEGLLMDMQGLLMDMSMDMKRGTLTVLTVVKVHPLTETILVTMAKASLSIMEETVDMVHPRMVHPRVVHLQVDHPAHNRVSFITTSPLRGKVRWYHLDKMVEGEVHPGGELPEIPWTCLIVNTEALPLNFIRSLDINQVINRLTRMFRDRPTKPSPTFLIDVIHSEFGFLLVIIVILYLCVNYGSHLYVEIWT